jgi:hypothetical protein
MAWENLNPQQFHILLLLVQKYFSLEIVNYGQGRGARLLELERHQPEEQLKKSTDSLS